MAGHVVPIVQSLHKLHHLNRIKIVDRFGFLVITDGRVIAGEAQNISNPQHVRAHQIRLHRDPIAITTGQLHHGIVAYLIQQTADRK